jgi:hypothetical protein
VFGGLLVFTIQSLALTTTQNTDENTSSFLRVQPTVVNQAGEYAYSIETYAQDLVVHLADTFNYTAAASLEEAEELLSSKQAYITSATNLRSGDGMESERVRAIVRLAEQLDSFVDSRPLVVVVDDSSLLNDTVRAKLNSMESVDLVDVAHVYENIFIRKHVPGEFEDLKPRLYSFSRFKEIFEGNLRVMMWLLYEYDQLLYLDLHTVVQSNINDVFESCDTRSNSKQVMCAPKLYQTKCEQQDEGVGFFEATKEEIILPDKGGQTLFSPRLMVFSPNAGSVGGFLDSYNVSKHSSYPEITHEWDLLIDSLADTWEPLSPCYSGVASSASEYQGLETYKPFEETVVIIQGASGSTATEDLNITSDVNRLYGKMHGMNYTSFSGRLLDEAKFTGHWDRYQKVKEELENYDYALWLDSDAMINRLELDLRDVISAVGEGNVDIIVGSDWEYAQGVRPFPPVNTGAMIFRKSNWTMEFIDHFLSLENDYCRNCAKNGCARILFHDQGCLEEYIMQNMLDIRDHMQILPVGVLQRKINDNFHIDGRLMAKWNSPYDFILHAAGLKGEKKKETLLSLNASLHNSSSIPLF